MTETDDVTLRNGVNAQTPVDVKRNTLSRMKSVIETLGSITKSLESHVEQITAEVIPEVNAQGIASLPDELLARIFEFHYQDYFHAYEPDFGDDGNHSSRTVLAKVCKRFNRIVDHLPALWEILVFESTSGDEIQFLKTKCQSPRIFINFSDETASKDLSTFLDDVHPREQWKELNLRFSDDDSAVRLFNTMASKESKPRTPFSSITSLSMTSSGADADEDFIPSLFPPRCNRVFSCWDLHKLSSLSLTNIIPNPNYSLINVRDVSITLGQIEDAPNGIYKWNMQKLCQFLLVLHPVQSLKIKFDAAGTEDADFEMQGTGLFRQLSELTSLSMSICGKTDPIVLKKFVEMVDMPKLANLDIEIQWTNPDQPAVYLNTLFKPTPGSIRTFPHVRKASLRIQHSGGGFEYPGVTLFRALPRLTSLSLATPGFQIPNLLTCKNTSGCLEELQTLHPTTPAP